MTRATAGETWVSEYGQDAHDSYERRPRRRRRGWPTLVAILLVLGAIAVVADRVAERFAAREIRAQVVAELSDRDVDYDTIDVSVGGFPFLVQVAKGRYEEIRIDMTNVRLASGAGRGATLPTLNVVAMGVDADPVEVVEGTAKVVAERITGTGVVSFQTLETLVDYSNYNLSDVRFTGSAGALRVTGTASLGGLELPISATADISVVDGDFQVRLRDARAVGVNAPRVARTYLDGLVERSAAARLPQLPFNLTLDDVRVEPAGLAITATARGVPLVS